MTQDDQTQANLAPQAMAQPVSGAPTPAGASEPAVPVLPLDLATLADRLRWCTEDLVPVVAIAEARAHREACIPVLLDIIRQAYQELRDTGEVAGSTHFIALYLLSEFGAREAIPVFLESCQYSMDELDHLYGDYLLEESPCLLAGWRIELAQLEELIACDETPIFFRWGLIDTYVHLVRDGVLSRDVAVASLRQQLQRSLQADVLDPDMLSATIIALEELFPQEAVEEIRMAFEKCPEINNMTSFESTEESLALGQAECLAKTFRHLSRSGIQDCLPLLERWHTGALSNRAEDSSISNNQFDEFAEEWDPAVLEAAAEEWERGLTHQDEGLASSALSPGTYVSTGPRVGRNDPCPCQSGKKFKKCCGRS